MKSLSKVGKELNWENSTEPMVGEQKTQSQETEPGNSMALWESAEPH